MLLGVHEEYSCSILKSQKHGKGTEILIEMRVSKFFKIEKKNSLLNISVPDVCIINFFSKYDKISYSLFNPQFWSPQPFQSWLKSRICHFSEKTLIFSNRFRNVPYVCTSRFSLKIETTIYHMCTHHKYQLPRISTYLYTQA